MLKMHFIDKYSNAYPSHVTMRTMSNRRRRKFQTK